ncbi:zinc finger BED domain-containing protein RICESLEEPER 2-like [Apium graveolens]|uniref:zinc finger BED domain-containing protein RICESLEEPER 2-like n=1 Tax=Apium graveolens TaxID=4045 RepID=UPI003D78C76E
MDASIVKIRESVKYIKGSQDRKEKFKECITQFALERKKRLCQDVPTRWNSTYLMLDGALYYRRAFTHLKLSDSSYKHGLEEEEWDKIEGIFQHTLEKAILDPNFVARSMAIKMQPKIDKYWSDYNMILAIVVVFDPRYKAQIRGVVLQIFHQYSIKELTTDITRLDIKDDVDPVI